MKSREKIIEISERTQTLFFFTKVLTESLNTRYPIPSFISLNCLCRVYIQTPKQVSCFTFDKRKVQFFQITFITDKSFFKDMSSRLHIQRMKRMIDMFIQPVLFILLNRQKNSLRNKNKSIIKCLFLLYVAFP